MTTHSTALATLDTPFARKLSAYVRLSENDLSVLSDVLRRRRSFAVGHEMVHQGQTGQSAFILASGWAFSYKILKSGTRQIVEVHVPGDMLGLRTMLLRGADRAVEPVTPVQAAEIRHVDVLNVLSQTPRLAAGLLWAAARDEAMEAEHLVDLGRRSAAERMAHFLLELGARLALVSMADRRGFDCPLSQYVLADALGLSAVHVNRVLRELREGGLVTFQNGRVSFDDYDGLAQFAGFDPGYLDHDGALIV